VVDCFFATSGLDEHDGVDDCFGEIDGLGVNDFFFDTSGFEGFDGFDVDSGFDGFDVDSGFDGFDVVSGFDGFDGFDVDSGFDGFEVVSGFDGFDVDDCFFETTGITTGFDEHDDLCVDDGLFETTGFGEHDGLGVDDGFEVSSMSLSSSCLALGVFKASMANFGLEGINLSPRTCESKNILLSLLLKNLRFYLVSNCNVMTRCRGKCYLLICLKSFFAHSVSFGSSTINAVVNFWVDVSQMT